MRPDGWYRHCPIAVAAVIALLSMSLHAQEPGQAARLSSVDGKVRILQGDQMLADSAVLNTPLFEGTQLGTSDDGRAEVQFDDGSLARISPDSSMTLNVLRKSGGGTEAEVALDSGLGYFELQGAGAPESFRIRFGPNLVTASGFTVVRINLDSSPGELAVFAGNAHLEIGSAAPGGITLDLHEGESVSLNASDSSRYRLAEAIEPDSWDSWNADRDHALAEETGARTTATADLGGNSANPGWSDLDASGNWYNVPGTGYVWSPYESAGPGWDPYGSGSWMWTPRFGYIWVSSYSWGYLPFQCGAWSFYDGFGWGWAPGMGGCNPWWNSGYYGINIGYAPGGYFPPRRPHNPVFPPGRGIRPGPHPLIAVNRLPGGGNRLLATREKDAPILIGGKRIQPLAQLPQRPENRPVNSGFMNAPRPAYSQPAYSRGVPGDVGSRSSYGPSGYGTSNPGRLSYGPSNSRTYSGSTPPGGRTSFGGGTASGSSHSSSGGGSHSAGSGGSSGGGSSHSGGGSSGGGGSHSGGGSSSGGSHK